MKKRIAMLFILLFIVVALTYYFTKRERKLEFNREYDKKTVVKPSQIPGAGNGLFASVKIPEGETIGEYGGVLVSDENYPEDSSYIACISACALEKTKPYKYLDGKTYGGNVTRTNFAPSKINDRETEFKNASFKYLCENPYIILVALRDIEPGEEVWASYGPDYTYDKFMEFPAVRDFFCNRAKINCRNKYTYED